MQMGPIITRNDVPAMKPDPSGLNYIIKEFQLQEYKEGVIYVGDSFIDADAANQANVRFILINYRNLDISAFDSKPWKVLSNLSELIDFLRKEMIDCVY